MSLNREVLCSNPADAVSNLGHVRLPHVAQISREASSVSVQDVGRGKTKGCFVKALREVDQVVADNL